MKLRLLILLCALAGCAAAQPLPPPRRSIPEPVANPVILPAQTFEPEPEVTPPLTRARGVSDTPLLPVPTTQSPASLPVVYDKGASDAPLPENPYAGVSGPPKAAPPRNFPVPPLTLPRRGAPNEQR